ncbi:MAG: cob(I)yrinic acid a,c-diamide adenosyltransferase [Bacteroidales bacterium]|jgi:cob(I)alamin adenosyltransferase|nr:cob(I)yrinic acid a,c-diamide adenosyltransferase [Bacteroidales bacterium]
MIYTKTGDTGMTSLVGGTRVKKYDLRVECYGTLDELSSHIGLVRDLIIRKAKKDGSSKAEVSNIREAKELLQIIKTLFNIQAIVANENDKVNVSPLIKDDVNFLEESINYMESLLPRMKSFILPTGYVISSEANIARTVCRRAERLLFKLNEETKLQDIVLQYINRLSDYLFLLSRKLMKDKNRTELYW